VIITVSDNTAEWKIPDNIKNYNSFESIPVDGDVISTIVIHSSLNQQSVMKSVAESSHLYLTTCYLVDCTDAPLLEVANPFVSWNACEIQDNESRELISLLPEYSDRDLDEEIKFLNYLFTHPQKEIKPLSDITRTSYYYYPLAELFDKGDDSVTWLNSLLQKQFLEHVTLVDRVRLCPHCQSQHINFIDRCPSCSSIDIKKEEVFHCFTCGTVALRRDFDTGSGLTCPQCRTNLRHIGVDYDRTLEEYMCKSCDELFSDPTVVARCFECGKERNSGDLETHQIYSYRLTNSSYSTIKRGEIRDVFAPLDALNFSTLPYFEQSVDWLLRLHQRKQETHFSILYLSIPSFDSLVEKVGRTQSFTIIEQFSKELRGILRTTDLITRSGNTSMIALLPFTPKDGVAVVVSRLDGLQEKMSEHLDIRWNTYTVDEQFIENQTASEVFNELAAVIEE
jgi:hypothetical protein